MHAWIEKMNWKLQCWMQGRYGLDSLSQTLSWAACFLILLSIFIPYRWMSTLAWVLLIFSMYRMCSKKILKRQKELAAYERLIKRPKAFFTLQKRRFTDRKTFRYFKCSCGKVLRVPRGKGKIDIACPACHEHMVRKS